MIFVGLGFGMLFLAGVAWVIIRGVQSASGTPFARQMEAANRAMRPFAESVGLTYREPEVPGAKHVFGFAMGWYRGYDVLVWTRARSGMQGNVHTVFRVWHAGLAQETPSLHMKDVPPQSWAAREQETFKRCFAPLDASQNLNGVPAEARRALLTLARNAASVMLEPGALRVAPRSMFRPNFASRAVMLDDAGKLERWLRKLVTRVEELGLAPTPAHSQPQLSAEETPPPMALLSRDPIAAHVSWQTGGTYHLDEDRFRLVEKATVETRVLGLLLLVLAVLVLADRQALGRCSSPRDRPAPWGERDGHQPRNC